MRNKWVELMLRRALLTWAQAMHAVEPTPWNHKKVIEADLQYGDAIQAIGRDIVDASMECKDAVRRRPEPPATVA